ncbi:MAG: hypothetical protein OXC42_08225 [Gammaproteobacteria bacterium]|nr:hypothetical protein [Gammaproteobacteria bacterium]
MNSEQADTVHWFSYFLNAEIQKGIEAHKMGMLKEAATKNHAAIEQLHENFYSLFIVAMGQAMTDIKNKPEGDLESLELPWLPDKLN